MMNSSILVQWCTHSALFTLGSLPEQLDFTFDFMVDAWLINPFQLELFIERRSWVLQISHGMKNFYIYSILILDLNFMTSLFPFMNDKDHWRSREKTVYWIIDFNCPFLYFRIGTITFVPTYLENWGWLCMRKVNFCHIWSNPLLTSHLLLEESN